MVNATLVLRATEFSIEPEVLKSSVADGAPFVSIRILVAVADTSSVPLVDVRIIAALEIWGKRSRSARNEGDAYLLQCVRNVSRRTR